MYKEKTHFHFMGIGGIGMSGIAKILIQKGYVVSGCDTNHDQKSIVDLIQLGCTIAPYHNSDICLQNSINFLVYSTDISSENPEFIHAKNLQIPIIHRSLVLAELMRQSFSIGVAGSHGKTTTTSLISHIFLENNLDPTVVVGGYLKKINSNAHYGKGKFLIAETDESDRSLLNLNPMFAILTSIDIEHMNTYKNLHDVISTFNIFLNKLPFYGKAFVCIDDQNIASLLPLTQSNYITYGFSNKADFQITKIFLEKKNTTYSLFIKKTQEAHIVKLSIPGEHNALNSVAALAVALEANIPISNAIDSLSHFEGVDRRFTYRGTYKNIEIFDDYGHHPTEIICTLKNAVRQADLKPLTVIFQPHRYTRTESLWDDFITVFLNTKINHLIITDIYSAGEKSITNITSNKLVEEIRKHNPSFTVDYVPYEDNHASLISYIQKNIPDSGVLLLQGAGSVSKITRSLL